MKYLFFLIIIVSTNTLHAQPGSLENDFKEVRNAMIEYFYHVSDNAYKYAPAGVLVGEGCFNDKMVTRKMFHLADPLDEHVFYSHLGKEFYAAFYAFSLANEAAFKEQSKLTEKEMHPQHMVTPCGECNIDYLCSASNHILQLFLPRDICAQFIEEEKSNIYNLYHSVTCNNNSSIGCKADGGITMRVHNAAIEGLEKLDAVHVNNRASTAGKLGMIMSHFYHEILELPVQDENTWLSPEWQVGYYSLTYATYVELKNMYNYPNSTSYLDFAAKYKY